MNSILTIVVATFNAEAPLSRTIASLKAQGAGILARTQLVLVDGASTDSTVRVAEESGLFARIVSERDQGVYDAMNKGMRLATSPWIQFLNAGDEFADGNALARVIDALSRLGDTTRWLVVGAVNRAAGDARIRNIPHVWYRHALGIQPHCHQATFFSTDLLRVLGGHSLSLGTAADFDVILRAGVAAGSPMELDEIVIAYEGGGMSALGPRKTAALLSQVRRERFALSGGAAAFNALLTRVVVATNSSRIALGAVRRGIRSRAAGARG